MGNTTFLMKDKKMLYRLELLDKISEEDRNTILRVVDAFLKEAQLTTTTKKLKSTKRKDPRANTCRSLRFNKNFI